jgi:hypothetical protein
MSEKLIPPRVVGTPEPETNADNDPELAALLEFEPVPRQVNRPDSWTPERQRRFLELIVQTGSPQQAARAMKKQLSGIESVYRDDEVGQFRASWDGICELVRTREERRLRALSADPIAEPPHRRNGLSPLAADYPATVAATKRTTEYIKAIQTELEALRQYIAERVPQTVSVVCIFVPMDCKEKLETEVNKQVSAYL